MSAPDTAMAAAMAKALRAKRDTAPRAVGKPPRKEEVEKGVAPVQDDIRSIIERHMK